MFHDHYLTTRAIGAFDAAKIAERLGWRYINFVHLLAYTCTRMLSSPTTPHNTRKLFAPFRGPQEAIPVEYAMMYVPPHLTRREKAGCVAGKTRQDQRSLGSRLGDEPQPLAMQPKTYTSCVVLVLATISDVHFWPILGVNTSQSPDVNIGSAVWQSASITNHLGIMDMYMLYTHTSFMLWELK